MVRETSSNEIEITPEMIEVGYRHLEEFAALYCYDCSLKLFAVDDYLKLIYKSMASFDPTRNK